MGKTRAATRLYAFQAGGAMGDVAVADPLSPEVGKQVFEPWFTYVVTHPQGNVLFDTGLNPRMYEDPASMLGEWADMLEMRLDPDQDMVSQLAAIDLTPADISTVVLSHLHFDHVTSLELFRHARIFVQRSEYAFAQNPAGYQSICYLPSCFEGEYDWHLIDGPLDIFDDRVIELIPTPGHSPGHQSMLVSLAEEKVLVLGDAAYQIPKMRERRLPAICSDPAAMVSSWELLEWLERRENAILLCTHDTDFRTRVKLAPDAYYE